MTPPIDHKKNEGKNDEKPKYYIDQIQSSLR